MALTAKQFFMCIIFLSSIIAQHFFDKIFRIQKCSKFSNCLVWFIILTTRLPAR